MNINELKNTLSHGEKAADIQEYYWGENGEHLVYKVIIYTCKIFLFRKFIFTHKYPFNFKSKELAEEFIQNHDKYKFKEIYWTDSNDTLHTNYLIIPKNISFKKAKCKYKLVVATCADYNATCLEADGIWDGYVECDNKDHPSYFKYKKYYTEIDNLESDASKEGTSGKTYSYKLTEV